MFTLTGSLKLSRKTLSTLLCDLANLRDGGKATAWWTKKHRGVDPELPKDLIELRDELRGIWSHPNCTAAEHVLDKWLRWRPSPQILRLSYQMRTLAEPGKMAATSLSADERSKLETYLRQSEVEHLAGFMAFRCSLEAGKLVPNNNQVRANLIQGVFEHWTHFRFCGNSECAAPFFIATRSDQTVCDAGDCKAQKQREHALKWWRENRSKKRDVKPKKGTLKNGARKAR